ncbi:DEAD/DEAH box helicase [Thalassospira sp. CH_XMU1448-2]|uniref:DEAD/DEAH box helicase n=1 Tax=Thalassospira sp. CH_XMU1448-2 TaxID=3107773 RepID=UPI0030080D1B
MSDLTLRKLRNSRNLFELYIKLVSNSEMNRNEREAILRIAVLFLNDSDDVIKRLGYRIVLFYSNKFNDYKPLYDIAINAGYAPISKIIEEKKLLYTEDVGDSFFSVINSSLLEFYNENGNYLTYSQQELAINFSEHTNQTVAVVAPTSYGKSELYSSFCRDNREYNICLIVPTKALLAQSKQRLLKALYADDDRRIITHPDMYVDDGRPFIAVLTQERLLRLLQGDMQLSFKYVFVDEAHNLLERDQRSTLLAQAIILLNRRDDSVAYKFLTPFLVNTDNLSTRYMEQEIRPHVVDERLKSERYYLIDFREADGALKRLRYYDQFFNEFSDVEGRLYADRYQFLNSQSARKNIIYLNSPPKIERFISQLMQHREDVQSAELEVICGELGQFIHEDFRLIQCLKKGLVYHHGSLPDIVKLYVEHIFSEVEEVSHIVTSSTLLEGVNIPAEKLFLIEMKKGRGNLSPSQFQNLVGRVCRFSEIFNSKNGSPSKLEPSVFVVGSHDCDPKANLENFLTTRSKVDRKIKDNTENVLLENTELKGDADLVAKQEADQVLENLSPGITGENVSYATSQIGRLCFVHNVTEIDILRFEHEMDQKVSGIPLGSISSERELLRNIVYVFINHLKDGDNEKKLERLKNLQAQNFYSMYLAWRMQNTSYSEMISHVLRHWDGLENPTVFVHKWGDFAREEGGHNNWYVNIREKTRAERVNLAVVRIKEEQDFVDNLLIKFIEVFHDLELVDEDMYLKIKYGTNDRFKIALINCGINNHLANLLLDDYSEFLDVDVEKRSVKIDPAVINSMVDNDESSILVFETQFHIRG